MEQTHSSQEESLSVRRLEFSQGEPAKQTLQFSGGEPVDKTFTVLRGRRCRSDAFTVLAGRLGQSDATASSLYFIRTA